MFLMVTDEVRMSLVHQEESFRGSSRRPSECRREINRDSDADGPNLSIQDMSWKILFVFQTDRIWYGEPLQSKNIYDFNIQVSSE